MSAETAVAEILLKLAALLLVARATGYLFDQMKQPKVLGELLAGVLLGPSLFGFLPEPKQSRKLIFIPQLEGVRVK